MRNIKHTTPQVVAAAAVVLAGTFAALSGGQAFATRGADSGETVDGPASQVVPVESHRAARNREPVHGKPGASPAKRSVEGLASMRSPFIPGVPHVPSGVSLIVGPDGEARFVSERADSVWNGPFDEVSAEVDAWWARQMAAGVSPQEADVALAGL